MVCINYSYQSSRLYRSVCQCKKLRRLDVGNNEIDTLVCMHVRVV